MIALLNLLVLATFTFAAVDNETVVRGIGGNCVGLRSCRPSCMSFQVIRNAVDCRRTGAFAYEPTPWDLQDFRAENCETCMFGTCLNTLPDNLTIRVTEQGHTGVAYSTLINLTESENLFTFCSLYECPNTECETIEQLGSTLKFEFLNSKLDSTISFIRGQMVPLTLELSLTRDFDGTPFSSDGATRFGPLVPVWADDPTDCRNRSFSDLPPRTPLKYPRVIQSGNAQMASSFCARSPELPTPVQAEIESGMLSVEQSQLAVLKDWMAATETSAHMPDPFLDWFSNDSGRPDMNYCNFTGITCDADGYIVTLDLNRKGLTGTMPPSIVNLTRLRRLKVWDNNLRGEIPFGLVDLTDLRQISLGRNSFVGTIPEEYGQLTQLRRLMIPRNNFHGSLPSSLCNLVHLKALDISDNHDMFGGIPPCLGNLVDLSVFRIRDVGLTGDIPQGLCGARDLNGMHPNTFGCDAIGCGAGFYKPKDGRQLRNESRCLRCDSPSNVIGSTTCQLLEEIEHPQASILPSRTPTTAFTMMPSVQQPFSLTLDSPAPTSAPSRRYFSPSQLSPNPSSVTLHPHRLPTGTPSIYHVPIMSPTPNPTLVTPHSSSLPPNQAPQLGAPQMPVTPTWYQSVTPSAGSAPPAVPSSRTSDPVLTHSPTIIQSIVTAVPSLVPMAISIPTTLSPPSASSVYPSIFPSSIVTEYAAVPQDSSNKLKLALIAVICTLAVCMLLVLAVVRLRRHQHGQEVVPYSSHEEIDDVDTSPHYVEECIGDGVFYVQPSPREVQGSCAVIIEEEDGDLYDDVDVETSRYANDEENRMLGTTSLSDDAPQGFTGIDSVDLLNRRNKWLPVDSQRTIE